MKTVKNARVGILNKNHTSSAYFFANGFTLVEIVLVIALLGIVAGSILTYFFNIKSSGDPVLTLQAIELAQEKMDKILADKKWNNFNSITPANYPAENPVSGFTTFNRSVDIFCVLEADLNTSNGTMPNCTTTSFHAKRVEVTVSWGSSSVSLVTVLTDY